MPLYLAPHDTYLSPLPSRDYVHFVISAKSACGGGEPGSRKNLIIFDLHWTQDLARNDGLGAS